MEGRSGVGERIRLADRNTEMTVAEEEHEGEGGASSSGSSSSHERDSKQREDSWGGYFLKGEGGGGWLDSGWETNGTTDDRINWCSYLADM
jgi:hypothetical protein